jgi:hypothetical protein
MNPIDIHRLQVLNDLVAQTIDIINQRNLATVGFAQPLAGGYFGNGLSHTPLHPYAQQPYAQQPYAQQPWGQQPWQQQIGMVPQQYTNTPWGGHSPFAGLTHTPYVDPRWAFATPSVFPMMPFVR